jgi:leader peptidase (prepilin peptidase)/N-methyltransferase
MRAQLIAAAALATSTALLMPRLAHPWLSAPTQDNPSRMPTRSTAAICTASAAALLAWRLPTTDPAGIAVLAGWLTFVFAGVLLSWVDVAVRRLPTRIIAVTTLAVGLWLTAAAVLSDQPTRLLTPILAAAALGGGYLVLIAVGASQMGMGDVRLAALTGLVLGTAGWHTVLIGAAGAYLLAAPFAVATLRKQQADRSTLPLGPFLVAATVLAGAILPGSTGVLP